MSRQAGFLVVFCTAPPEEADALARALVEERLAACVNIAAVRSCYIWEGRVNLDGESLLIIKTNTSRFETLKKRILDLHSYAVPEIVALPVVGGHQDYLDWLAQSVG
jgi:periplasmic divalent cation tolerance protein